MIHHLSREPRVQRLNQRCILGDVAQLSACFECRVAYFNPSRFRASLYLRQTWHVFTVNESVLIAVFPIVPISRCPSDTRFANPLREHLVSPR